MDGSAPRARPRWLTRVLVAAVLVGGFAGLRLTVFAPDPVPVRVVAVARGRVEATVGNSKAGTVTARRRSRITAETGGRVIAIEHREGAQVEAGSVLVRLNDSSARAQVELSEQGVRVADARRGEVCLRRDRARRELARMQKLAAERIVSDDVLDELQFASDAAASACGAALAEQDRARASLAAATAELRKTLIVAPFDGVVAEVSTELGEWVTPSPPLLTSPAVVDLIDPTSLYVSAPMDEVDSNRIRQGQRARISVDSHPDTSFPAHVVRVAPYVLDLEAQNRTVEIEVELDDQASAVDFLPGTSADVEVVLDEHADVPRIPTSALIEGNRVLVIENDVLSLREVELGLRNWDYAELLAGLELGERVVTSLDRVEVKAGARAVVVDGNGEPAS